MVHWLFFAIAYGSVFESSMGPRKKLLIRFENIFYHIFHHFLDYLEDMRERKVETNSEAQKLIDEIQKFTTSYMNTIQSHCDKLIEKVQKNRALKIQKVEEVISEIEQLENETESTLDIRFASYYLKASLRIFKVG